MYCDRLAFRSLSEIRKAKRLSPRRLAVRKRLKQDLSRFDNFSGLDAAGADLHPAVAARRKLNADGLQIRVESASRLVVSVGNVIAKLRALPTYVASLCHKIIASDLVSRSYISEFS